MRHEDRPDRIPAPRLFLRTPVIDPQGQQIIFVHAGDLWLVPATGGEARRLSQHPAGHAAPRWSHDGRWVAFTSARAAFGEIYLLPTTLSPDGSIGEVQRLTHYDGYAQVECWSPDDQTLLITSAREQQGQALYRIDRVGGQPIGWLSQPYEQIDDVALSPDGTQLAVVLVRQRWERADRDPYGGSELWIGQNEPGLPNARLLPTPPGVTRSPHWFPDQQSLLVMSDRDGFQNLWRIWLDGRSEQLTFFRDGRVLWPSLSADGRVAVFERDFGIWRLDLPTAAVQPLLIAMPADRKSTPPRTITITRDMSELALAPDGKKVAFVARGEVFADFADKETDKELRAGPAMRLTNTAAREADVAWSPDSRSVVYTSDRDGDPQVYRFDLVSRREERLTSTPQAKAQPTYAPDGNWLAYISGDTEIRLIDLRHGTDQSFITALFRGRTAFVWSPDSAWIAFIAEDQHHFENIYVQQIGSTAAQQISFLSNQFAYNPIWLPNGQSIIFTTGHASGMSQVARIDLRPLPSFFREAEFEKLFPEPPAPRNREPLPESEPSQPSDPAVEPGQPEPSEPAKTEPTEPAARAEKPKQAAIEIHFAGIDRRLRLLTTPQFSAVSQAVSPDSRDLIVSAGMIGKINLWLIPLDEPRADQPPRQLTNTSGWKASVCFSGDGKQMLFLDGGQIVVRKHPNGEPIFPAYSAEMTYAFTEEKWQIFQECWRLMRDYFYDPTFRGLDWQAIRERYAPLIAGAQITSELYTLISMMTGELRASHMSIGGSRGGGPTDGFLGVRLDPAEQVASGRLIVAAVLPESPAALAGVQVGSELLAIDGQALGSGGISLDRGLQRSAGRRVRLRVGLPDSQGEHELALRPIGSSAYDLLVYRSWVARNEQIVHTLSHDQLGYIHIPEMSPAAYDQFLVDLDTEIYGKRGLVIDVRFNHGGFTAPFVIDILMRPSLIFMSQRDGALGDAGTLAGNRVLNRPTILLVNQQSASNAEMLAEFYRGAGLGQIVGQPTAGAVIGIQRIRLLDGATYNLPRMRVVDRHGQELEGTGRPVDHAVLMPLGDPARGRDPQLETAVQTLMAQIGITRDE